MDKFQQPKNDPGSRPFIIRSIGTNLIYYKNPKMVAWWSAALPGLGHILLGQNIKGILLFVWEIVINIDSNLNLGLVTTLEGDFDKTKWLLDPRWILLYAPVYLFSIWDSYQMAIIINHSLDTLEKNHNFFDTHAFGVFEINHFTKKKPYMALFWSLFSPGAGQLYLHRLLESAFFMFWFIVICYYSHFFEGCLYLLNGDLQHSNRVLDMEWFMFLPSVFFFSAYNAYSSTIETNIIFWKNQTAKLKQFYQNPHFEVIFPKSEGMR